MGRVLHRSATTTEATRRAIRNGQDSLRVLSKSYGINQKTVAKWKKRASTADLKTGPREPKSTVLSVKEAMTDIAAPKPQPAGSLKRDPGKLALRATRRHVVRFKRGLIIGVVALGSGAILGVTIMALQGPALRIRDRAEELYNLPMVTA